MGGEEGEGRIVMPPASVPPRACEMDTNASRPCGHRYGTVPVVQLMFQPLIDSAAVGYMAAHVTRLWNSGSGGSASSSVLHHAQASRAHSTGPLSRTTPLPTPPPAYARDDARVRVRLRKQRRHELARGPKVSGQRYDRDCGVIRDLGRQLVRLP